MVLECNKEGGEVDTLWKVLGTNKVVLQQVLCQTWCSFSFTSMSFFTHGGFPPKSFKNAANVPKFGPTCVIFMLIYQA